MSEREIDQQLVERAQRGDRRAFDLLVEKYQRKLARLLSRLIRDPGEVEDVTQEAFVKAYRALPSFRGESAFYTWLYRIGINTAKNYLVAMGRRAPTSTEVEAEEAEGYEGGEQLRDINTPESLLLSKEIAGTVNAAIEDLPEELRSAIQLRELEGMSYEEIAKLMDCPIGTVRSRIFRAREAIAEKLKPLLDAAKERGGDVKEKISALMDGELERHEAAGALNGLAEENESRDAWRAYHLIGDAMRDTRPLSSSFAARVSERLAKEPTVLAPGRIAPRPVITRWQALSAAASVAAVALVGWVAFGPQQQAAVPVAQVAPQSTSQSAPIEAPVKQVAPPDAANDYLLAHQGYSPRNSLQGVAPYVRMVSGESGPRKP